MTNSAITSCRCSNHVFFVGGSVISWSTSLSLLLSVGSVPIAKLDFEQLISTQGRFKGILHWTKKERQSELRGISRWSTGRRTNASALECQPKEALQALSCKSWQELNWQKPIKDAYLSKVFKWLTFHFDFCRLSIVLAGIEGPATADSECG